MSVLWLAARRTGHHHWLGQEWLDAGLARVADGLEGLEGERPAARLVLARLLRDEPDLSRLATGVGQMIQAILRLRADAPAGPTDLQRRADAILLEMGLGPPAATPPAPDGLAS